MTTWSKLSSSLASQQQGGDSPGEVQLLGLQERNRSKMMVELRKFTTMDNHEAVQVGDLERIQGSLLVVEPKFSTDYQNDWRNPTRILVKQDNTDRRTTKVADSGREPPLVDEN